MLKFLIFVFFICCLSAGNSLKLKSLCNERVTRDGSLKVNSYYRLKLISTFPPISHYLPKPEEIQNLRFSNPYVASFDSQLKKHLKEIYNERWMNSSDLTDKIREKQNSITSLRDNFQTQYNHYERQVRVPLSMFSYVDQLDLLLNNLTKLRENNLTTGYLPVDELRSKLEFLIEDGLDDNQTSTFADEFIDVFYERQLATFDGFRMTRGTQQIFMDESSFGVEYITS